MPNLDEVKQQTSKLGWYSRFYARREIRELARVLWDNEAIEDIVVGVYAGRSGVLVATGGRLVFVGAGGLLGGGVRVEDFPYSKISSIQYESRLGIGGVTIFTSGNKAVIGSVVADQARAFAEATRRRIALTEQGHAAPALDPVGQLERLVKLRDDGALSAEEFQTQKARILGA